MAKAKKSEDYEAMLEELKEDSVFQRQLEAIKNMAEPERSEAITQLTQDYDGAEAIIARELSQSDEMFDTPMPEGRQAGSVYVAANPLEFMSTALRRGVGSKRRKDSMDAAKKLSDDRSKGQFAAMSNSMKDFSGIAPPATEPQRSMAQKPDLGMYGVPDMAQMQSNALRTQPRRDGTGNGQGVGVGGQPQGGQRQQQPVAQVLRSGEQIPDAAGVQFPELPMMASHKKQPLFGKGQPLPANMRVAQKKNAALGDAGTMAEEDPWDEEGLWLAP